MEGHTNTTNLVLEVVPPVGPRLLNTSLLLDDRVLDDSAENTECHRNSVVIVAVHADAPLELRNRFPYDFKTIIEFDAVDAELGYVATKRK